MKALLAPGLVVMRHLSNKGKMPLCSILYLLPAVLLYIDTGANASIATRIAMVVLAGAGAYLMYCWYIQAREGFGSLEKVIAQIAEGDLASDDRSNLGGSFSRMMKSLSNVNSSLGGIVASVRDSANAVARSATEIADANSDLSNRTEEQASSLEETASGMEELARTVKQNAANCESAAQLAQNAASVARQGAEVVHGVVQGMGSIDQSSRRIADIIGVIEGIAFQTNILALNAAVEAARAGELGRGFAVVASEVRTLAQSSAQAAKEIRALIQQSVDEIKDGSRKAERAGTVIDEIVTSVHEVSQLIGQIAVSSSQQSAGVGEINKAIVQLETVTQQNAAVVQEVAASSFTLQEQADRMRKLVARFKVAGEAGAHEAHGQVLASPSRAATGALALRPTTRR